MTNYERIKAMSVEELAELLNNHNDPCKFCVRCDEDYCRSEESGYCEEHIKKWLESEVEEE